MSRARSVVFAALVALSLGSTAGSAESRRVYYEVDGHKYWYNPNSRRAKERARQEAEAAAKAAAAENAKPALLKLFGPWPSQPSAPAATAPSSADQAETTTRSEPRNRKRARRAETTRPRHRPMPHPVLPPVPHREASLAPDPAPQPAERPRSAAEPAREAEPATALTVVPRAALPPPPPAPTVVHTLTYDFVAGIRRMRLSDGRVFEERFDPKAFYHLAGARESDAGRKDTTGSVAQTAGERR